MNPKMKAVRSRVSEMALGKTTYIITTSFSENARETVEQKLIRYLADRISSDVKDSFNSPTSVETCYVQNPTPI